ncbi:CrpP-related protein [Achromobacter sp. NFACC18-2]|uniref:CrpP-related protein n=1 Tax=Achromobacter sp. NFACC18-2 TaxID=1564112 RepID=UPI000B8481D8|nr:CrpP-related protein [Achromobacter sp. NFACC18-2]
MHSEIRKQGALAARQGLTLWDCPYLKAEAMPGHTGGSLSGWKAKVDAWEEGWRTEVQAHSSLPNRKGAQDRSP